MIAGGGPAGAAAALVLARAGRRVLLADASIGGLRFGEALPPAARLLLRDLGALPRFISDRHLPCFGTLSAWGAENAQMTDFIFDVNGGGFHLDRSRFDASLRAAARDAGAEVISGVRVEGRGDIRLRATGYEEVIDCRWVIDASGRAATISLAHGAVRMPDDTLLAFYARFCLARGALDQDSRTLIEARPDGWWYTALVPSGERVVAFLTDKDLADRAALLSPQGLLAHAARTTHVRALLDSHGYTILGRPRGAAAASTRLRTFTGKGWLAAGDAALAFDPLSSQGILNALYTGMQAGRTVDAALAGDHEAPARYSSRLEEIYRAYRRNLATFYSLEGRWRERVFWRRRLSALPARHSRKGDSDQESQATPFR